MSNHGSESNEGNGGDWFSSDDEVCTQPASTDPSASHAPAAPVVAPCAAGSLGVTVRERTSRSPIQGATVRVAGPPDFTGTTDEQGQVRFEDIPAQMYMVSAERRGFVPDPGTAHATVQGNTTTVVEVILRCQARFRIVNDSNNDRVVDENEAAATFVRFGLWNHAYDGAGNVKNAAAEADNFIGADARRFYFLVEDPMCNASSVQVNWWTLRSNKSHDDAPGSQVLSLLETRGGSKVFASKAVMLVTNDTDRNQRTHSGLAAPHADAGVRRRGQSNHRIRRGKITGFVKGEYQPACGGARLTVEMPVFKRSPDERKRLSVKVIRYTNAAQPGFHAATANYISGQFEHANMRWNQVGLQIDAQATTDRQVPAAALNPAGLYAGSCDNAFEQAALRDLIPITTDNTLTVVFVPLSGANAYATIGQRTPIPNGAGPNLTLGDRFFVFVNTTLAMTDETLAHELHHVLFNRFDTNTDRHFYTFNTTAPSGFGLALPDVRVYHRIQSRHTADPNNDPNNDNIINWFKRRRTARYPIGSGMDAATATTGNTLVRNF